MPSRADYLKKYLRGPRKPQGPPSGAQGGLRLGEDEELDLRPGRRQGGAPGGPGGRGGRTLFTVLRRAEDGARYLFKDENPDEMEGDDLLGSDAEEVRVVGEDGQALVLSEADKAKVQELIAREEMEDDEDLRPGGAPTSLLKGRNRGPLRAQVAPARGESEEASSPQNSSSSSSSNWKAAFALDGPVSVGESSHMCAASPYEGRDRRRLGLPAEGADDLPASRRHADTQQQNQQLHRNGAEQDSGSRDLSPPRRRPETDRDISPPRRTGTDRDISPPRRRKGRDQDLSPPRRIAEADRDISPPRRRAEADRDISPPRRPRGPPVSTPQAGDPKGVERCSSSPMNAPGHRHSEKETVTSAADRDFSPRRSPTQNAATRGDASREYVLQICCSSADQI